MYENGLDTFHTYRSLTSSGLNIRSKTDDWYGTIVHLGYIIDFIEETKYISNYNMKQALTII